MWHLFLFCFSAQKMMGLHFAWCRLIMSQVFKVSPVTKHSSLFKKVLFSFFFPKILKEFCPFPVSFLTGEPRTFYLSQLFPFSSHALSRTNTKLAHCFCADRFDILFQACSHDGIWKLNLNLTFKVIKVIFLTIALSIDLYESLSWNPVNILRCTQSIYASIHFKDILLERSTCNEGNVLTFKSMLSDIW